MGKRNFLELKLQFSSSTNSKLSKFRFSYAPFCQRYALYGIPNCRTVEINFNNAQCWSSSSHLECLVLSLWKKESHRRMATGGSARVGQAEGRGFRCDSEGGWGSVSIAYDLGIPLGSVDQSPGCSDSCISLAQRGISSGERSIFLNFRLQWWKARACRLQAFCESW